MAKCVTCVVVKYYLLDIMKVLWYVAYVSRDSVPDMSGIAEEVMTSS
jgi:hypothetical protein